MQKWEYMTVKADHARNVILTDTTGTREGISNWLDGRGEAGWELVSATSCADYVDHIRLYFKRPMEEEAATT